MIKLETLPQKAIDTIMERLADEHAEYYFYVFAAAWAKINGYDNIAKYLTVESHGEDYHFKEWIKYLSDWNVKIDYPTIKDPVINFTSIADIMEKQYQMELELLKKYEQDATLLFSVCQGVFIKMQGFVSTQNYAVISVASLITKMNGYLQNDPDLRRFDQEVFYEYQNYY